MIYNVVISLPRNLMHGKPKRKQIQIKHITVTVPDGTDKETAHLLIMDHIKENHQGWLPAAYMPAIESKHHDLKCLAVYFEQVANGTKTFELRENDRGFKQGDTVTLKEYLAMSQTYTGRELTFKIGYVLSAGDLNLLMSRLSERKFVIFSLLPLD
jgi:hypothetical protein